MLLFINSNNGINGNSLVNSKTISAYYMKLLICVYCRQNSGNTLINNSKKNVVELKLKPLMSCVSVIVIIDRNMVKLSEFARIHFY